MHDPVMLTAAGAIPLRMRKPVRSTEPDLIAAELERLGVPILGRLPEGAWADGGDRFWIDDTHDGDRHGLPDDARRARPRWQRSAPDVDVGAYDLPHDAGPDHVLHLQSMISALTDDLLVIYEPLSPSGCSTTCASGATTGSPWRRTSTSAMGCNVLCVRPGVVVMVDGVADLRRRIEARGVEVHAYDGSELSLKGDGGPTCLTCPLWRSAS